ncbi:MAG: carboxylating nicotinate-nucleotide diphosphorylase [Candidatus Omnitrophica bacterium]|nr:carboxylating nicotinate-nucleotide diphosphorylase [Candidatus Omnitrophota bacterium]
MIVSRYIKKLIKEALKEDIGKGDITTSFLFKKNFDVDAVLVVKEDGIICGIDVFKNIFLFLSPSFRFKFYIKDGDAVYKGMKLAEIKGPIKELLTGERTALNFLQHLSGIATLTKKFVEKAGNVSIYDTRKTTPLLRELEKYAVKVGEGKNHRFGLFDMVLIKDNHITGIMKVKKIDRVSAISYSVEKAKKKAKGRYKVEVEVENFDEAVAGYRAGADIIMFDNADEKELKRFVDYLGKDRKKVIIEWSGNVTLETIDKISKLPVDRVSVGAITHSANSLDFSLKIL